MNRRSFVGSICAAAGVIFLPLGKIFAKFTDSEPATVLNVNEGEVFTVDSVNVVNLLTMSQITREAHRLFERDLVWITMKYPEPVNAYELEGRCMGSALSFDSPNVGVQGKAGQRQINIGAIWPYEDFRLDLQSFSDKHLKEKMRLLARTVGSLKFERFVKTEMPHVDMAAQVSNSETGVVLRALRGYDINRDAFITRFDVMVV